MELHLLGEYTEGGKGLLELRLVELLVTVEVHLVEDSPEGSNSNASLLLDRQFEFEVELSHHNVYITPITNSVSTEVEKRKKSALSPCVW